MLIPLIYTHTTQTHIYVHVCTYIYNSPFYPLLLLLSTIYILIYLISLNTTHPILLSSLYISLNTYIYIYVTIYMSNIAALYICALHPTHLYISLYIHYYNYFYVFTSHYMTIDY